MQVTNSAVIVDYFPEAFIAESCEKKGVKVVVKRFIRRVKFRATGQKSYSTVLGIEAKYDWQARIAKGAEVTDFNTEKMPRSEFMPLACVGWFMSLIKLYLHNKMMDRLEMLTQREQLMEDIDCIIESNFGEVEYKDDVIRQLCDAVCKNFPTD